MEGRMGRLVLGQADEDARRIELDRGGVQLDQALVALVAVALDGQELERGVQADHLARDLEPVRLAVHQNPADACLMLADPLERRRRLRILTGSGPPPAAPTATADPQRRWAGR